VKLAVQEPLVPGATLADKVALAEDIGFEGMEFWGGNIAERVDEIKAAFRGRKIRPSTICAGCSGALVTADPELRRQAREGILQRLQVAAELEMVGLIVVPVFNNLKNIPDLSPYKTAQQLGEELLIAQLEELVPQVEKLSGPCILLEPLNRYEANFLSLQEKGAQFVRRFNSPALGLICDFFHMNIEETNTAETLRKVGDVCRHVHLADNTRKEPGTGTIDFKAGFAALKEKGYGYYMAFECGLSGPDAKACLTRSVEYLKRCM